MNCNLQLLTGKGGTFSLLDAGYLLLVNCPQDRSGGYGRKKEKTWAKHIKRQYDNEAGP